MKAAADGFEEEELITDIFQCRIPFEAVIARDCVVSRWAFEEAAGKKLADKIIGDEADKDSNGEGEGSEEEGYGPLRAIQAQGR